ncbi:glycosyltransferase [Chelativorans sp. YIM 93263]|uniref:glycosyltransferase n=1 Tax=Chelativorans sp. YIM 93263 TaxID=2906648 RepID=UPI002379381F|nr:glycosyltransferase [Chelativorans sp. YIM 93263]
MSLSYRELLAVEQRAYLTGVSFQTELLASGMVDEVELYRALAAHLHLGFVDRLAPEQLLMRSHEAVEALRRPDGVHTVQALDGAGGTMVLIAPGRIDLFQMRRYLWRYPRLAERMSIAPPSVLRRAVRERARNSLLRIANGGLFEASPRFSARYVVTAWQGVVIGAFVATLGLSLFLWTAPSLLILHCFLSLAFFACILLRLVAGEAVRKTSGPPPLLGEIRAEEMPVYTVLVALYKEAEIVPDLIMALGRIVWPRSKLEIKLVCESDDRETLNAIRSQELRSYIEVIEVPPGGPRTKPKALSYALPMSTGEFVVLFDAEDKPHPFQLVEAWQRFRQSPDDLACLQAPLVISNRHESWISNMFAFEYSALFSGILPWLARRGLMLPLGGTSNHFRRAILERIGGWDPCNVTEDADLGVRLARLGYRTGTIAYPTFEDAPTRARIWLPQRTRWFKGWAQTWLVHMRDVPRLWRELGPTSFLVMQILIAGMLISALAYPVFVLTIAGLVSSMALDGPLPGAHNVLLAIDLINIVFGHGAFLALGWWTLPPTKRRGLWKHMLMMPPYWLLMSVGAWRALWSLYRRPHHWAKTPHKPSRSARAPLERGIPSRPNPTAPKPLHKAVSPPR